MEKKITSIDPLFAVCSVKTIEDYHRCNDKDQFIQEILSDQEQLRQELRTILDDVSRYKQKTSKLIDNLISDNVSLRHRMTRVSEGKTQLNQ
jgi:hypothetical protein